MLKSSSLVSTTISLKLFLSKSFKSTRQFSFISCLNNFNYCQQKYNWNSSSVAPSLLVQTQNIQNNKLFKNYQNFYFKNLANQNHVISNKHFSTSTFLFNELGKKCNKCGGTKPTSTNNKTDDILDIPPQLGLFAKFKLMYKKYWYVLIPVHVLTSIGWYGSFYYISSSGVDIPALLEYWNISDVIIDKFKNNKLGHYAIAYLCYKFATPFRYALTLGGTTVCIRILVKRGYIKPIPTRKEFLKMYQDKKASTIQTKKDSVK